MVVGAAIGLAVGFVGRWLRNRIDDPPIEIAGSILLAYVAYLPGRGDPRLRGAGRGHGRPLPGLAQQQRRLLRPQPPPVQRLLGNPRVPGQRRPVRPGGTLVPHLQRPGPWTARATGPDRLWPWCRPSSCVRLVWMWAFGWLIRADRRRGGTPTGRWRERLILGWSGMRGAITLAALLAVPTATSAGNAARRSQRHHLPRLRRDHRHLGRAGHDPAGAGEAAAAAREPIRRRCRTSGPVELTQAALDAHRRRLRSGKLPEEVSDGLRAQYLGRLYRLQTRPMTRTSNPRPRRPPKRAGHTPRPHRPATPDAGCPPRPGPDRGDHLAHDRARPRPGGGQALARMSRHGCRVDTRRVSHERHCSQPQLACSPEHEVRETIYARQNLSKRPDRLDATLPSGGARPKAVLKEISTPFNDKADRR